MPDPDPSPSMVATSPPFRLFDWLSRVFSGRREPTSAAAIQDALDNGQAQDVGERALLNNIINLRDLEAYDIMIPRADIVAFDSQETPDDIIAVIKEKSHGRYPVYRGQLDDIIGFVHTKDVLTALYHDDEQFDVLALLNKPVFIAPSMRVMDLLLQMRESRVHMVFVVDEYGGIDGLVTIEDIVQSIIGRMSENENGDGKPHIMEQAGGALLVDARTPLEDLEGRLQRQFELEDDERDEIDTVGGFVTFVAGRVPNRGEMIRYNGSLQFEVLDADPRRIKWLRVNPKKL